MRLCKNIVEPGRPQMTTRRMRIAFWIPKATNVLSEYVPLIDFPLQRSLHERASNVTLYVHCPSCFTHELFTLNTTVLKYGVMRI
jgi:hypothetical protein